MMRIWLFLVFALAACDSRQEMREKFDDERAMIVVDQATGEKYIVLHELGDNYSLHRIK